MKRLKLVIYVALAAGALLTSAATSYGRGFGPRNAVVSGTSGEVKLFSNQITCTGSSFTNGRIKTVARPLSQVEGEVDFEGCQAGTTAVTPFKVKLQFNINKAPLDPKPESFSFGLATISVGATCQVTTNINDNLIQSSATYTNIGTELVSATINIAVDESAPHPLGIYYVTNKNGCPAGLVNGERKRSAFTATYTFAGVEVRRREELEGEEGEWLVEGVAVTSSLPVVSEGTVMITDLKTPTGITTLECTGIFVGSVGPEGGGEVTELLNSKGENKALVCKTVKGSCESSATSPEVVARYLPWKSDLILDPAEEFKVGSETKKYAERLLDVLYAEADAPGYEIKCKVLGLSVVDVCLSEVSGSVLTQEGINLLSTFEPQEEELTEEAAACTLGGAAAGVSEGHPIIKLTGTESGLTLSAV